MLEAKSTVTSFIDVCHLVKVMITGIIRVLRKQARWYTTRGLLKITSIMQHEIMTWSHIGIKPRTGWLGDPSGATYHTKKVMACCDGHHLHITENKNTPSTSTTSFGSQWMCQMRKCAWSRENTTPHCQRPTCESKRGLQGMKSVSDSWLNYLATWRWSWTTQREDRFLLLSARCH